MDRSHGIAVLRDRLATGGVSVGTWMQLPSPCVAEMLGDAGYDWVAVDMEHGSVGVHQLPDLFRALELGGSLPLVRLIEGNPRACKQALDAGAAGVIVPMIESAAQLQAVAMACRWPPAGHRGVGFSRANLYGKRFAAYRDEAEAPLLVAMIEHHRGVAALADICRVDGLDAVLVGPYDLSASLGVTGELGHPLVSEALVRIAETCSRAGVAHGLHVVDPDPVALATHIADGLRFIAYGIDALFLRKHAQRPTV
jgi:2-dehydro-3-deoxyglucarate aldolase